MKQTTAFPKYVEWQITNKCGLRCLHCHMSQQLLHPNELRTADAINLIHQLIDAKIKSITLSGGEPMERCDWDILVGILKDAGISVQLISNGQKLHLKQAKQLKQLEVDFVWLSLDGPLAVHNRIRQNEHAFDNLMNAASMLHKLDVPFGYMTTLLKPNHTKLMELSKIVKDTHACLWQLWLGNRANDKDIWLSKKEIQTTLSQLTQIRLQTPQMVIGDNIGYTPKLEYLRTPAFIEHKPQAHFSGCYGGNTVIGIQYDGSLKPCLAQPHIFDSNKTVVETPLLQLYKDCKQTLKTIHKKIHAICGDCALYDSCNGGCPAYMLSRRNENEDSFCFVPKIQKEHPAVATISASLLALCTLSPLGCQPTQKNEPGTSPISSQTNSKTAPNAQDRNAGSNSADTATQSNTAPQSIASPTPAASPNAKSLSSKPTNASSNRMQKFPPCSMSHVGCRNNEKVVIPNDTDSDN